MRGLDRPQEAVSCFIDAIGVTHLTAAIGNDSASLPDRRDPVCVMCLNVGTPFLGRAIADELVASKAEVALNDDLASLLLLTWPPKPEWSFSISPSGSVQVYVPVSVMTVLNSLRVAVPSTVISNKCVANAGMAHTTSSDVAVTSTTNRFALRISHAGAC